MATLRLGRPVGVTLACSLAALAAGIGVFETLGATGLIRSHLLAPSVGTRVRHLDIQLARLDRFAAADAVDCVVLGSSVVYMGVNPGVLADAWDQVRPSKPRCFALGIVSLVAPAAAPLAELVVERYRPRLLVYAMTPSDLRAASDPRPADPISTSPWIQQRQGDASMHGWLIEHSLAYRYLLTYRQWRDPVQWRYLQSLESDAVGTGFWPTNLRLGTSPPAQKLPPLYQPGDPADVRLDVEPLERLAALRERGVDVVLVEVPLHPTAAEAYQHGAHDHVRFREAMEAFARTHDLDFWQSPPSDEIPDDGWFDRMHLNEVGARVYSRWLGTRLADRAQKP